MNHLVQHLSLSTRSAAIIAASFAVACSDVNHPTAITPPDAASLPPSPVVVSNPRPILATSAATSSTTTDVVYVSLPRGSIPNADAVTIRVRWTGSTVLATAVDGGFDPLAVRASVGDTVDVEVRVVGAAVPLRYSALVPRAAPPRVIRISPPPNKRDVPLNTNIIITFSEPIFPTSLNASTVQLAAAAASVQGQLAFADSSRLTATLTPDAPLDAATEYTLNITRGILDLDGQALDSAVVATFTTAAAPLLPFASVTTGAAHSCALTTAGAAYCWGENSWGQLGDGTTTYRSVPVPVLGGITFVALSAGYGFNCGLSTAGAAYCWGTSYFGQLGNGTFGMDRQTRPMPVVGGLTFTSIAVGNATACGVTADGAAYCWGFGGDGNLGNGADSSACHPGTGVACAVPVPVVGGLRFASLSLGDDTTCGITTTGAAYCWGGNFTGELGIGNWTGPEECYDDSDVTIIYFGCSHAPVAVSGNLSFTKIEAGGGLVCGLRADAKTFCWGGDAEALTGAAPTGEVCNPYNLACRTTPVRLENGLTFTSLSLGIKLCGVTPAGAAYCWGGIKGDPGPLGYTATAQPVDVALRFATAPRGTYRHMCGVMTDGAVYCWGQNYAGQLGDGTTRDSRDPVRVREP